MTTEYTVETVCQAPELTSDTKSPPTPLYWLKLTRVLMSTHSGNI